jgi:hypothetical protein
MIIDDFDQPGSRVPPLCRPKSERQQAAEARFLKQLERQIKEDVEAEYIPCMAQTQYENDPEGMWSALTEEGNYDPRTALRLMRDGGADVTRMDTLLLMDSFMGGIGYYRAVHAKLAIGNIIGHKHLRHIRVRGRRYWLDDSL